MADKKNENIIPDAIHSAVAVVFFALYFLYLWFIVDPKLIFHSGGKITNYPVFFKGLDFFFPFLSRPGGAAEYLAAFLSQGLFFSWLGALVLTAVGMAICFCLRYILKSCGAKADGWFWFLPVILFAVVYGRYSFNFVTTVALLISLVFLCLYLKIKTKTKAGQFFVFTALSIASYSIAGGAFLLFVASAILYDLFFRNNKALFVGQFILSILIPYTVGFYLAGQTMIDACTSLLPFSWKIIIHEDAKSTALLMYSIYLLAPVAVASLGIITQKPAVMPAKLKTVFTTGFRSWSGCLITLLIIAAAVGISFDRKNKRLFQCDYYSYYQDWDKVVTVARNDLNSMFLCSAATRALYHQDKLFDKMFEFYQFPTILFMQTQDQKKLFWKQADIYFELGYINMAEHKWTSCLDAFGERPMILKRLAWINMVKENSDATVIYLNSLKRTFFFNDFADKYLALLKTDPDLLTDPEIQNWRKKMITKDYSLDFSDPETALINLLQSDINNRMAYEYQMSWFLLTRQLDKIALSLNYLKFYNYTTLPQCLEDAALLYQVRTGKKLVLNEPLKISSQAQQRYANFSQICSAYQANETAMFDQLRGHYGNDYLFYFLFNRSGMKQ